MDISKIKKNAYKALNWKDNKKRVQILKSVCELDISRGLHVEINDTITATCNVSKEENKILYDLAWGLRPWRKGPFRINDIFIDSEWKSYIKYNLLEPHFDLKDKIVGDIGCNNGYYMYRMLAQNPAKIVGFDPALICKFQFDFINHFIRTDKITFEPLGVEHLPFYTHKFDFLFCLGVLYHRSDPIGMLKDLHASLHVGGELILDTFMIDGDDEMCLSPANRYAKMRNVYFIPTQKTLQNWCERAKFRDFEVLATMTTDENEQRKTPWILGESLGEFLDPYDKTKTIEGYPAPKRIYIKLKR